LADAGHKNGHKGHAESERILASSGRTEAERGFCRHLGTELITTSHAEDTAVRLADRFESANLCARGWIQNLEGLKAAVEVATAKHCQLGFSVLRKPEGGQ